MIDDVNGCSLVRFRQKKKETKKPPWLGLGKDHWIKISMLSYVTSASLQMYTDQPKDKPTDR